MITVLHSFIKNLRVGLVSEKRIFNEKMRKDAKRG